MSKRVVVTGGGGFVGQWLARALLARKDRLWMTGITEQPLGTILAPSEWAALRWVQCDVRDPGSLEELLRAAEPDEVYHLAGISLVSDAERFPEEARRVNVGGGINVVTAVAHMRCANPVVIVVGSGTQYGAHSPAEMPLTENATQNPVSVYGMTKLEQEREALRIGREQGVRVICTRSFNHSGPGQSSSFLLPSLVDRVRKLPPTGGVIPMGNDTVRDYLHVADVVDAYIALAARGVPGEAYNVASGEGIGAYALAREVLDTAGVDASIDWNESLSRPADIPILVGSPAKLTRTTGWSPRHSRRGMIRALLDASPSGRSTST